MEFLKQYHYWGISCDINFFKWMVISNYRDIWEFKNLDWLTGVEDLYFLYDEHLSVVVHSFQHCAFVFCIKTRKHIYMHKVQYAYHC